ncbi:hypothetical protein [Lacrimispora sp.]|nr:hypothetical protein [Lacrimispora sp.]
MKLRLKPTSLLFASMLLLTACVSIIIKIRGLIRGRNHIGRSNNGCGEK